jgi:tRNA(Ile)-lysidine synthase
MDNNEQLLQSWKHLWCTDEWYDSKVVIGVSGGADSVALLTLFMQLRPDPTRTIVAHFNHGLRGNDSDGDESFVREFAKGLSTCFVGGRAEYQSDQWILRSESGLRKQRYQFLQSVAEEHQANWIALGHQADDVVETFLHHLLRGSGPSGLASIRSRRKLNRGCHVVRPLLNATREQIEEFLSSQKIAYRTDTSNNSNDYTRNRIRNQLLPALRKFSPTPGLDARLLMSANLIAEQQEWIEANASEWLEEHQLRAEGEAEASFTVPLAEVVRTPWPVMREAMVLVWKKYNWPLQAMNAKHWNRLRDLIDKSSKTTHRKRLQLPSGLMATCSKGFLRIEGKIR